MQVQACPQRALQKNQGNPKAWDLLEQTLKLMEARVGLKYLQKGNTWRGSPLGTGQEYEEGNPELQVERRWKRGLVALVSGRGK